MYSFILKGFKAKKPKKKNNKHGDFQDLLTWVNFWVSDLDAFRWIFLAIFGHFLA